MSQAVVVGIDGSDSAVQAARWAVTEAVSRDIPLRLVAVAADTHDLPAARSALRAAAEAVRSATAPIRVDTAALTGAPTLCLLEESRNAAMICIGALGSRHLEHQRIGSTAAALAASAYCPVAVIRGRAPSAPPGAITVALDERPDSAAVLQAAVAQARLRSAPLRILGAGMTRPRLDERLSEWHRRYPGLDVDLAPDDDLLRSLSMHGSQTQLVVIGARDSRAVAELLGARGQEILQHADCSMLIVDPQRLL